MIYLCTIKPFQVTYDHEKKSLNCKDLVLGNEYYFQIECNKFADEFIESIHPGGEQIWNTDSENFSRLMLKLSKTKHLSNNACDAICVSLRAI